MIKILENLNYQLAHDDQLPFYSLRYPEKQNLFTKWKALYEEYKNDPAIRNILWPWNEHFNIEVGEDQPIITTVGETLRLINFRTEYQINTDGSVPEKTVLKSTTEP